MSYDRKAYGDYSVLHACWPYEVCTGLVLWTFERQFKKTKVDCLSDISNVATTSSSNGLIIPQLCGTEDGNVIVPTYGWDSHLCPHSFRKLPSMKKYHNFTMKLDGSVTCKEQVDSQPITYCLKQPNKEVSAVYPGIQQPTGPSHDRQFYLYREIREFVDDKCKDLV